VWFTNQSSIQSGSVAPYCRGIVTVQSHSSQRVQQFEHDDNNCLYHFKKSFRILVVRSFCSNFAGFEVLVLRSHLLLVLINISAMVHVLIMFTFRTSSESKVQQLKHSVEIMSQNHEREVDMKDAIIQMLDRDLDEVGPPKKYQKKTHTHTYAHTCM